MKFVSGAFRNKMLCVLRFFFLDASRTFLLPHDVAGFPKHQPPKHHFISLQPQKPKEKRTSQKLENFPHHRTFPPPFFLFFHLAGNARKSAQENKELAELAEVGAFVWRLEMGNGKGKGSQWSNMGVSKNRGTPKSSIFIGFSIINHSFWGTPIFGNTHMFIHSFTFDDHFLHVIGSPFCLSLKKARKNSKLYSFPGKENPFLGRGVLENPEELKIATQKTEPFDPIACLTFPKDDVLIEMPPSFRGFHSTMERCFRHVSLGHMR